MLAAALCFGAAVLIFVSGLVSDDGSLGTAVAFMSAAMVWFIIAIAVRSKNT